MPKIIHKEFGIRSEILEYHKIGSKLKGMREGKPFVHDDEIRINIGEDLYKVDLVKFYTDDEKELTKKEVSLDTETRVAGVIINKYEILLLKVNRPDNQFYCFPGGHRRENETIEECLSREMKEETDIDISAFKSELLIEMHQEGFGEEKFFLINIGDNEIQFKDEHPDDQTTRLTVLEIEDMFKLENVLPKEVVKAVKAKL
jgi:ADP-ribose pyrophosphatase YjhB (NUDIX family)